MDDDLLRKLLDSKMKRPAQIAEALAGSGGDMNESGLALWRETQQTVDKIFDKHKGSDIALVIASLNGYMADRLAGLFVFTDEADQQQFKATPLEFMLGILLLSVQTQELAQKAMKEQSDKETKQ
jgi:hypothetical protein